MENAPGTDAVASRAAAPMVAVPLAGQAGARNLRDGKPENFRDCHDRPVEDRRLLVELFGDPLPESHQWRFERFIR